MRSNGWNILKRKFESVDCIVNCRFMLWFIPPNISLKETNYA